MKTAVIDVGGGMRDIYGSGVFDFCLDNGIGFDYCIGISAGSANISSYLAGQRGRSRRFYDVYSFRKEYMSFGNYVRRGSYVDLDYVYGVLTNSDGEDPLDYEYLAQNPSDFTVIATEAKTGKASYFTKSDIVKDDYRIIKASSSIPVVSRPCLVGDSYYYDGALSDPVPIEYALTQGCDRIDLIQTKPRDTVRDSKKDDRLARLIRRRYPESAKSFHLRAERYNKGVDLAKKLEKEGRVLIIAPDDISGVDTLKLNKEALERLYERGYRDASPIPDFVVLRD